MPNGGSDKQSPPREVTLHGETHLEIPPPLEGPACQDRAFCRMAALTSRALQGRLPCLGRLAPKFRLCWRVLLVRTVPFAEWRV